MNSAYIKYFLQTVKVRKMDVEAGPEDQEFMLDNEDQLPT
jgi:hypothetical protein